MKARTLAAALLVLLGFPAPPANGESASEALVGQRLRLTISGKGAGSEATRIVGLLTSTDENGMTLTTASGAQGTLKLPYDVVMRTEVSTRRSRKRSWALIGAATGAVIGGAIGYSAVADCSRNDFFCIYPKEDRAQYTVVGALIFGAAGAGLGALIGPGERWQDAGTQRLRLSLAPTPHRGARVAITLGF